MAKPDKLTRRQIDNQRWKDARYISAIMGRLRMAVIGEPATIECGCGQEHEIFPNEKAELSSAVVNAAKVIIPKVYPDISAEDWSSATEEPKTREELAEGMKDALGDKELMKDVIRLFPKEAKALRDQLNKALPQESKVVSIQEAK